LIHSGKLRHNGNKILSAMAGNVSVKTDPAGNLRPVKPPHGSSQRIDGIVALIMAIGAQTQEKPEEDKTPEILIF
jgi:phage terminase large subunit-like protein